MVYLAVEVCKMYIGVYTFTGGSRMDEKTAGDRLNQLVGAGPGKRMTISGFHRALQRRKPKPRGSTRGMIHRYLKGAVPPAEFIEAAADILGVSPEWLAFGRGPMTEPEQELGRSSDGMTDEVRQLWGTVPELANLPYVVTVALLDHLWQHEQKREQELELGGVWRHIMEPLGGNGRAPLDWQAFGDYVMAMINARNMALRIPTTSREG